MFSNFFALHLSICFSPSCTLSVILALESGKTCNNSKIRCKYSPQFWMTFSIIHIHNSLNPNSFAIVSSHVLFLSAVWLTSVVLCTFAVFFHQNSSRLFFLLLHRCKKETTMSFVLLVELCGQNPHSALNFFSFVAHNVTSRDQTAAYFCTYLL